MTEGPTPTLSRPSVYTIRQDWQASQHTSGQTTYRLDGLVARLGVDGHREHDGRMPGEHLGRAGMHADAEQAGDEQVPKAVEIWLSLQRNTAMPAA